MPQSVNYTTHKIHFGQLFYGKFGKIFDEFATIGGKEHKPATMKSKKEILMKERMSQPSGTNESRILRSHDRLTDKLTGHQSSTGFSMPQIFSLSPANALLTFYY